MCKKDMIHLLYRIPSSNIYKSYLILCVLWISKLWEDSLLYVETWKVKEELIFLFVWDSNGRQQHLFD
jgi:hypothetical protein